MDLLKEADMLWCQSSSMAIEQNHDLKELADQVPTDKGRYQRTQAKRLYRHGLCSLRFSKDRGPTWMQVLSGISGEFPACWSYQRLVISLLVHKSII